MLEGRIKVYFADKGFGFIQVANMKDVFFHINDMPQKHIEPKPNERVQFDVIVFDGKEKASNIFRLDLPLSYDDRNTHQKNQQGYQATISTPREQNRRPKRYEKQKKSSLLSKIAIAVVVIMFVQLAYSFFKKQDSTDVQTSPSTMTQSQTLVSSQSQPSPQFTCDGRQHCSQMNSLEEARYFVRHCPNTKMDGDGDGEPCENDSRLR